MGILTEPASRVVVWLEGQARGWRINEQSRLNGPTRRGGIEIFDESQTVVFSVDSPSQRVLEAKFQSGEPRGAARLTESRRRSVVCAHETCADLFPALSILNRAFLTIPRTPMATRWNTV